MTKLWWYFRLSFWMWWLGYSPLWGLRQSLFWPMDDCWELYRIDGESPRGAVLLDFSEL